MTETVEAPVVEELPMITVNDLDTFVQYLIKWHSTKITLLQHMQQIPEGTTVQAIGEDADRGRATAHIDADAAQIHLILFQGREGR